MCGSKGGGSPPVPSSQSTAYQSATAPSAFAKPLYEQYLTGAQSLSQTPFNAGMLGQVAPLNAEQTQAGGQLFNLGMHLGEFDPAKVRAIESPYTEDVVNATQNWFNNQNKIQGSSLLGNAIRSGNAFGGDRAGIAEAELAGQQQLAQAPVIAGLRQSGYTQALNEYNQLKQMGMAGAGAALGWGGQEQQQRQRELDVVQQNAMMQSQYPFQLQNWYGSALGGMAPLLGSFSQGYTTPPEPSALQQGIGIASSLVGLAGKLFTKDGGAVGHRARGGLVLIPPSREFGGPVGRARGGLVPTFQWGGSLEQAKDEIENVSGGWGGSSDDENRREDYRPSEKSSAPSFDVGQVRFPTQGQNSLRQSEQQIQQQMREQRQREMMDKQKGEKQDNSTASTIGSLAGLAVKAAPLMMMMSDRKTKTDVQRVGKTDDGKSLYAFRYKGDPKTYPKVVGPMAKPTKGLQDGGDVDDDEEDDDTDTAVFSATPAMVQTGASQGTAGLATPATSATPAAIPVTPAGTPAIGTPASMGALDVPASRPTPAVVTADPATVGDGGSYPRTTVIPGLGAGPRPQSGVWDALIGFGAGLTSRPNWYQGIGAGALAASGALDRARRDQLLDQKPQYLGDGKWRSGNKIIDTGIRKVGKGAQMTPQQAAQQDLREREFKWKQEQADKKAQQGPKSSVTQEGLNRRADIRNIEKVIQTAISQGVDPDTAAHEAIKQYNARYGTNYPVPPMPEKPAEATTQAGPGWWSRLWRSLTGGSEPATAAPAPAQQQPPATQQQAPPPGWQAPPRPSNLPAGSAYNAFRKQWRTPDGTLFDESGKPVQ